jgi:large subunit ribosomal protein L5
MSQDSIYRVANFQSIYERKSRFDLLRRFTYKNKQEIPRLEKIQINRGLGTLAENSKLLTSTLSEIRNITGQQPNITHAKKSIASFKIREKSALGATVTLRGKYMYSFLQRFVNLGLPRVRDFAGLSIDQFDKQGNYSIGVSDQLIFPEISYEEVDKTLGFNITFITTTNNPIESFYLLKSLGLPFNSLIN